MLSRTLKTSQLILGLENDSNRFSQANYSNQTHRKRMTKIKIISRSKFSILHSFSVIQMANTAQYMLGSKRKQQISKSAKCNDQFNRKFGKKYRNQTRVMQLKFFWYENKKSKFIPSREGSARGRGGISQEEERRLTVPKPLKAFFLFFFFHIHFIILFFHV